MILIINEEIKVKNHIIDTLLELGYNNIINGKNEYVKIPDFFKDYDEKYVNKTLLSLKNNEYFILDMQKTQYI